MLGACGAPASSAPYHLISGAVPFIQKYFSLSGDRGHFLLGLAVSCLGWGVLGGTAVAGFFSDRFGRKKVLLATAVFFTGSALLSARFIT